MTKVIEYLRNKWITPVGVTGEGTGDGVEATVLPALSPHRLVHKGAGRWGSLIGMGANSINGERGRFVPAEAVAEDLPQWLGAPTQGLGEQDSKPHTSPPLGGEP